MAGGTENINVYSSFPKQFFILEVLGSNQFSYFCRFLSYFFQNEALMRRDFSHFAFVFLKNFDVKKSLLCKQ